MATARERAMSKTFNVFWLIYTAAIFVIGISASSARSWDLLGAAVGAAVLGGAAALLTVGALTSRA